MLQVLRRLWNMGNRLLEDFSVMKGCFYPCDAIYVSKNSILCIISLLFVATLRKMVGQEPPDFFGYILE